MKVSSTLVSIEKSDDIEEVDFSIENSPLAFEILSAGIYTDRVLAAIRELSCNAYDAHKDGENSEPFEIHLPNSLEPYFTIRDKGTGLPPEMVKKLYTRYFKSTKTHSNEFVGFMGLGSKSPFAYVDSFNVNSYWNGVKYMFTAFKNEIKKPSIASLGDEPTTEANGLEISFPVKKIDFNEFQHKAKEALKFFLQKPIVRGIHNFEIPEVEYLIEGDGYGVTKTTQNSYVVMGNVGYNFEYSDFENTEQELSPRERKLVNWGIHLFVKIGTVTPAASREKITWTPDSRTAIKKLINNAIAAIEKQAQDTLLNVSNVWDARKVLSSVKKGILAEITDVNDFIEWNGKTIRESIHIDDYAVKPALVECLSTDRDTGGSRRRRRYGQTKFTNTIQSGNNLSRWTIDTFFTDTQVIFVNDLNRGGYAAAKRYMEENNISKTIMFSDAPKEFIDEVGCEHLLIYVSKLPKPVRAARGTSINNTTIRNRTLVQTWDVDGQWKDVEIDPTEGGVYLEVRRDKVKRQRQSSYDFVSARNISGLVNAGKCLGFDEPLYVIRPCDLLKITKHEGWITYYQWIEDVLKQRSDLTELANMRLTFSEVETSIVGKFCIDEKSFSEDSYMRELVDIFNQLKAANESEEVISFIQLNQVFNAYSLKFDEKMVEKINNSIDHVYPLLRFLDHRIGYSLACKKEAIHYINMIDDRLITQKLKITA